MYVVFPQRACCSGADCLWSVRYHTMPSTSNDGSDISADAVVAALVVPAPRLSLICTKPMAMVDHAVARKMTSNHR